MPFPIRSIAVISSSAPSLCNFRAPLIAALAAQGIVVYALAPDFSENTRLGVQQAGGIPIDIDLDRTGIRPLRDARSVYRLMLTLRKLRVDATFAYFIKPVIFGSLAAALARVPHRFALIAGLGYVFTQAGHGDDGWRRSILRNIVSLLYRLALATCERVFFQNHDDMVELGRIAGVSPDKTVLTNGTGVDLATIRPTAPPSGTPVFLFVGRLLREKGIEELVMAARLVRRAHPEVRVRLVGGLDANPGSFTQEHIEREGWSDVVELPGHVSDVLSEISRAGVFVLPSWREGKPRSTQEAMAAGRAVITTDVPGCRDTVRQGINGFLVPVRDSAALAEAMKRFVRDPVLVVQMGLASRAMATELFDVHKINAGILEAMGIND